MGDTLANIRTSVRKRIGNPSDVLVLDTDLNDVINRAIKDLADRYRFHATRKVATFLTVAGTDKYVLPPDYNVVMKVARQDASTFGKIWKTSFGWINNHPSQINGKPTKYAIAQNYIQLWPTPDIVYTIQLMYRFNPVALAADGDTSPLPSAWDEGIILCSRHMYWDDNGDVSKATYALNKYNQWLEGKSDEIGLEYFADWEQGVSIPTLSRDTQDYRPSTPSSFDYDD